MSKNTPLNTSSVFLDLEDPNNLHGGDLSGLPEEAQKAIKNLSTNKKVAEVFLEKFLANKESIGKRIKETGNLGISYSTKSVHLYHEAKELYSLGYFYSTIMVCRSTTEYLAYEIFVERIDLEDNRITIEMIAEDLDFRKIVNDFLCPKGNTSPFIDAETKKLFNKIYDLGNDWVHPKRSKQQSFNVQSEAKKSLEMLRKLIDSLRNVLIDHDIEKGQLKIKETSREKYKRGIKIEENIG